MSSSDMPTTGDDMWDEVKPKHTHNWIIKASDIRYREVNEAEYVMDIYVCECGAGHYIKTPKKMFDKGLKVLSNG